MSQNRSLIDVPPPPRGPERYFYVYGEWTQTTEGSALATIDNPNPNGQAYQRRIGLNEAIAMHPAIYTIMIQQARPGYTIRWAIPMSKEEYDWFQETTKRINAAIAALQG